MTLDNYSTDIEFSLPDENSMIQAKASPGSLTPGSVVVIANDMNGFVYILMWEYEARNNAMAAPVATQSVIAGYVRRPLL